MPRYQKKKSNPELIMLGIISKETAVSICLSAEIDTLHLSDVGAIQFQKDMSGKFYRATKRTSEKPNGRKI